MTFQKINSRWSWLLSHSLSRSTLLAVVNFCAGVSAVGSSRSASKFGVVWTKHTEWSTAVEATYIWSWLIARVDQSRSHCDVSGSFLSFLASKNGAAYLLKQIQGPTLQRATIGCGRGMSRFCIREIYKRAYGGKKCGRSQGIRHRSQTLSYQQIGQWADISGSTQDPHRDITSSQCDFKNAILAKPTLLASENSCRYFC